MSGNGERPVLVIRGLEGYLEGETYRLRYGESVRVGRSRGCGLSLKRTRRFREGDRGRARLDADFLRVSRNHLEIAYPHEGMVEIRDLSRNGVFLDDRRIDRVLLTELDGCRIRFGGRELIALGWSDDSEAPAGGGEGGGGRPGGR